ncbi:amino acid ABC transporter permease [Cytobacillus sp. FSL W7-1323]|uniref:Amino acid ABC transporter substrate-binding protein n=1 Tax=Cytobacillus kochii TaxID=859143 RepID=A0A248TI30_9BACI|nr:MULTISPECIES: amino acid ABC transporter permease [Cytobacillus]ASV67866.1 amino acid ABC transporter substrate-binding protein [Cytobacillus kochii]MDQ0185953.1 putative lysine transport system permease protein [Cytobacillus kochii]MEA1853877.1 amino acid ABC transporter permease [Cytobacillus sp. OWB-43]MED1605158.1 amino acid ABC transporter permease [Cytobacillus kochii]
MSIEWIIRIVVEYWPMFLRGAGVTLVIALIGTVFGALIGLLSGILRTIPIPENGPKRLLLKIVNFLLSAYIEFFRGTPMIVQAMVIFYGAAMAFGYQMDPLIAGIVIVSINTGAYMAEIVRGGIISVDPGQYEAAQAIGMNHLQTMMNVVLPQVIRNILPATGNQFIINIKDTAVLSVISISELFFQTNSIAGNNFRYFESFFVVCIIYFVMTYTVTLILRYIERRMDGPENYVVAGEMDTAEDIKRKTTGA